MEGIAIQLGTLEGDKQKLLWDFHSDEGKILISFIYDSGELKRLSFHTNQQWKWTLQNVISAHNFLLLLAPRFRSVSNAAGINSNLLSVFEQLKFNSFLIYLVFKSPKGFFSGVIRIRLNNHQDSYSELIFHVRSYLSIRKSSCTK